MSPAVSHGVRRIKGTKETKRTKTIEGAQLLDQRGGAG